MNYQTKKLVNNLGYTNLRDFFLKQGIVTKSKGSTKIESGISEISGKYEISRLAKCKKEKQNKCKTLVKAE